jgi:predicted metal-dependent hydrolase
MVTQLQLGEIAVEVVLKDIKNIHLSVYPPAGKVRISAPSRMTLDSIRVFAISKLDWIKQQQERLRGQERETPREYLDRESHLIWGKRYLLKVIEGDTAECFCGCVQGLLATRSRRSWRHGIESRSKWACHR